MQSDEEDTSVHSCFDSLKTAVMGCCYSLCHKESDPQEATVNERTRLLQVAEEQQESPMPAASATTPPRKPDEQSALNRILSETATNVIDVGALGPYALEAGVYNERVRAYSARVGLAAGTGAGVAPRPRLLADLTTTDAFAQLSSNPVKSEHREFLTSAIKRAAAAISELRVEHHEELVVPFRVS